MDHIGEIAEFLNVPAYIVERYPGVAVEALGERYLLAEDKLISIYNKQKYNNALGKIVEM